MSNVMKFGFFLLTEKGFRVLKSLIENDYCSLINFVCIGKDFNVQNDYSNEIEELCRVNGVNYFYRNKQNNIFKESDFYFAVSWKWIIDLPNLIVLHDSILPRYRGFAPLINMLINGEDFIGVTAILAKEEYDEGPIIGQESIQIKYPIKISEAIDKISNLYVILILRIINQCIEKNIILLEQCNSAATYSLWLDEDDYFIDWSWCADKIIRKIDACGFPYAGARSRINNEVVIIDSAILLNDIKIENRKPGKVIFLKNGHPVIVCGKGLLMITAAKLYGSNKSIIPFVKIRLKFT